MLNPMMEFENAPVNSPVNLRTSEVEDYEIDENIPKVALVAAKKMGLTYTSSKSFNSKRTSSLMTADGRATTIEFPDAIENGYITNNTSLMSKISLVDGKEPGRVSKKVKRASVNVNEVNRARREAAARKSVRTVGGDSPVKDFRISQAQARNLTKKKETTQESVNVIREEKARISKSSDRQQRSKGLRSMKSEIQPVVSAPTLVSSKSTVGTVEIIRKVRGTSENRRLQREEKYTEGLVRNLSGDVAPVETKKKQSVIKKLYRKVVPKKSTNS